jgi:hypothetical protein
VQLALRVGDLQQDVDERAALEVVALELLVEDVEDREQTLAGIDGAVLDLMRLRIRRDRGPRCGSPRQVMVGGSAAVVIARAGG